MLWMVGDLVGCEERGVARAAQAPRGPHQQCSLSRPSGVERSDTGGIALIGSPLHLQVGSRATQRSDRVLVGRWKGTQKPDTGVEHQFGRRDTRQQGDLSVPSFDVQAVVEDEPGVPVFIPMHLLGGERQAHGTARLLQLSS